MGASVTVAEAQASRAAGDGVWRCEGEKVLRCIMRVSANKVQLNFTNKTYGTINSEFLLNCAGPAGQTAYVLKKGLKPRGGYLSKVITCPKRLQDSAIGIQRTPSGSDAWYTPRIAI